MVVGGGVMYFQAVAFTSISPDTSSLESGEGEEESFGTGMASEEVTGRDHPRSMSGDGLVSGHLLAFARHLAEISDEDHMSSKGKGKAARAAHATEAVITVRGLAALLGWPRSVG